VTFLNHGIVDCRGFEILESLPWEPRAGISEANRGPALVNWGFLICSRPHPVLPKNDSKENKLYGTIGPIESHYTRESCLGIPLKDKLDPQSAMSHFALACGLFIIEKANLELGDTVVVAGANLLALSVLVAASMQGAMTVCLVSGSEKDSAYRQDIENISGEILDFEYASSFDEKLDNLIARARGKTVFVDTAGQPSLVFSMATRLEKFGTLALCRQDVTTSVILNIGDVHHRKSARFIYWSRPENLEDALRYSECCRRGANLFHWERVRKLSF
jgi:hypothetical protein